MRLLVCFSSYLRVFGVSFFLVYLVLRSEGLAAQGAVSPVAPSEFPCTRKEFCNSSRLGRHTNTCIL